MYKNLRIIKRSLLKKVCILSVIFILISLTIGRLSWSFSCLIGSFFSYFIFERMLDSQSKILKHKNKDAFFLAFLTRLGIVSIPLLLANIFYEYLNLVIVILFLFSFQFLYIILELKKNYHKYKRRRKQWIS